MWDGCGKVTVASGGGVGDSLCPAHTGLGDCGRVLT